MMSNTTEKPRVRFEWPRDENGNLIHSVNHSQVPEETSFTYSLNEESDSEGKTSVTESIQVTKRKRHIVSEKELAMEKLSSKWERDVYDGLYDVLKSAAEPLENLRERNANEGDTRMVVNEILSEGLGYDRYNEITTEYAIKRDYADYCIKLDDAIKVIVEVKRVGRKLTEKDVNQVDVYAAHEGVEWILLTNGITWQLYHLTSSLPLALDLVFEVSVLSDTIEAVNKLRFLAKPAMQRNLVEELWHSSKVTNPESIRDVLVSDPVVSEVRKEIWRRSVTGLRLTDDEVLELIKGVIS